MARRPIQDEFQHLNISRQRKYQLRQQRDGRCTICGKPSSSGSSRCLDHLVIARERQRRLKGWKRRYHSTSYKIEEKLSKRKK